MNISNGSELNPSQAYQRTPITLAAVTIAGIILGVTASSPAAAFFSFSELSSFFSIPKTAPVAVYTPLTIDQCQNKDYMAGASSRAKEDCSRLLTEYLAKLGSREILDVSPKVEKTAPEKEPTDMTNTGITSALNTNTKATAPDRVISITEPGGDSGLLTPPVKGIIPDRIASGLQVAKGPDSQLASKRLYDGTTGPIQEIKLPITDDTTFTVEARSTSSGSQLPRLSIKSNHGYHEGGIGVVRYTPPPVLISMARQIDNNEDRSNEKLPTDPPPPPKPSFTLLVWGSDTTGQVNIYVNKVLFKSAVSFGGMRAKLQGLRRHERIETIRLPNGAGPQHKIFVVRDNQIIDKLAVDEVLGGISWQSKYYDLQNIELLVGSSGTSGPVRLLRNDVDIADRDHDLDGDGLGDELEAALGTCSALSGFARGFDCRKAADARDTDGDGISDGWEVLGRRDMFPEQALALWGADPRHKDLFLEIDFMQESPNVAAQMLTASRARELASYYQDQVGELSQLSRLYHAASLGNPDMLPGINVHIDSGRTPVMPSDAIIYGDWGGYNVVPPVMKNDGSWTGASATQSWKTHMTTARQGIFRHMMGYPGGGGQAPINSFAVGIPLDGPIVAAHEFGHGMGLAHSGPFRATGDIDPNCKPNYPSLINYAFMNGSVSFSDGLSNSLNNASLKESGAISPSRTGILDILEDRFNYWVDRQTGSVDWNRDGNFAPATQRVRAYANFRPGTNCEYTRYNQGQISNASSTRSPAIVRLGNRTYVFYVSGDKLRYSYSTSKFECPKPAKSGHCGSWKATRPLDMKASAGVDAVRIRENGVDKLLVVSVDKDGGIWSNKMTLGDGYVFGTFDTSESWSKAKLIGRGASQEPTLATMDGRNTFLAYKDKLGYLWWSRYLSDAGGWQIRQPALSINGDRLRLASYASPGLGRARLEWSQGAAGMYGAFENTSGQLWLWWFNPVSTRWERTDAFERSLNPGNAGSRPALAYVPYNSNSDYPGRLYVAWSRNADNKGKRETRWAMSYIKVTDNGDTKQELIGLNSPFDNSHFYTHGIDFLYEHGVDSNLRATMSFGDLPGKANQVFFRPKADGINDFTYSDYNDWEILRNSLCRNVVNPAKDKRDPIVCR